MKNKSEICSMCKLMVTHNIGSRIVKKIVKEELVRLLRLKRATYFYEYFQTIQC